MARILPWLVGGGAIAAYAWSRSQRAHDPNRAALPGHWVWPVPSRNGRRPVISDGFGSPRPNGARHGGVDLMYARVASDTPGIGTRSFVMPEGVAALAAGDGTIWSATKTPRGFAVVVDHGAAGVATFYTHLTELHVPTTTRPHTGPTIHVGQPLGVIGSDPLDREHVRHLHFEIWRGGPNDRIDPASLLQTWAVVADSAAPALPRNGELVYRPVGAVGEPYPAWIRALEDRAGVYLIREAQSRELLYIGSSTSNLYRTITRHLQVWRRAKRFWRDQFSRGHDPGTTYDRSAVEVAVRVTAATDALAEESRLIERLAPRDNILGQRELAEDPPF